MSKVLFIYNPHSGTGKMKASLSDVVDIFTKNGCEVTVYPTQSQGDCTRRVIAAEGENFDRIIAAGGDGMLHELVAAVAGSENKTAVGYIPSGTVNDFASTHRIPKSISEAAENAVRGTVTPIDAGRFNQTYFSYVAAFGLITHVSYSTDQRVKNRLGNFAYFLEALKSLDIKHFEEATCYMKISAEDMEIEGDFIFGAVTNSMSLGGMTNFSLPGTKLDDGLLEGIFIKRPKTFIELELIQKGLFDKSLNAPNIISARSASFRLETEQKIAWTLDGENGGTHDNVNIEAIPNALQIALPNIEDD